MDENERLGEEKDAIDAPDVSGRSEHLREEMGKNENEREDGR